MTLGQPDLFDQGSAAEVFEPGEAMGVGAQLRVAAFDQRYPKCAGVIAGRIGLVRRGAASEVLRRQFERWYRRTHA